jgi:hypothetical protein
MVLFRFFSWTNEKWQTENFILIKKFYFINSFKFIQEMVFVFIKTKLHRLGLPPKFLKASPKVNLEL